MLSLTYFKAPGSFSIRADFEGLLSLPSIGFHICRLWGQYPNEEHILCTSQDLHEMWAELQKMDTDRKWTYLNARQAWDAYYLTTQPGPRKPEMLAGIINPEWNYIRGQKNVIFWHFTIGLHWNDEIPEPAKRLIEHCQKVD